MSRPRKAGPPEPPRLQVTRARAVTVLTRHAEDGRKLLADAESVGSDEGWKDWGEQFDRWRSVTSAAVRSLFSTAEPSEEFSRSVSHIFRRVGQSDGETFNRQQQVTSKGINTLMALGESLEYLDAPEDAAPGRVETVSEPSYSRAVFVVHGRDEGLRQSVARVLERIDFEPIILAEEPNQGRTVIEKFEAKALDVGFAVVILSSDDYARGPDESEFPAEPNRARQNVVLELGYFMGKLGRARVAALYKPGTELPSDIHGLAYVEIDAAGAWRFNLANELAAARYDVDLNRLKGV